MPDLHLAQDRAADALLSRDPLALLLGMLLDQQMMAYIKHCDFARGLVRPHLG